jgi:pimeloyl-ACP methyl ester carboxylesterase
MAFRPVLLFLSIGTLFLLSGGAIPKQSTPHPAPTKPGIVFLVEGVGGFDIFAPCAQWALPRAGVPHEIRHFVWSHGWGHVFKDLQDVRHLQLKAEELAEEVVRYKELQPDRPVYLVGKSGGTALILAAAEKLPPRTVERIILLSAAVSPHHDLRPALRATEHEIVSYYSGYDRLVLGWGTSEFGTADRCYGPSAGLTGFIVPGSLSAVDRSLYDRLVQLPWGPRMILEGHLGTHTGTSAPAFLGKEVATWLR